MPMSIVTSSVPSFTIFTLFPRMPLIEIPPCFMNGVSTLAYRAFVGGPPQRMVEGDHTFIKAMLPMRRFRSTFHRFVVHRFGKRSSVPDKREDHPDELDGDGAERLFLRPLLTLGVFLFALVVLLKERASLYYPEAHQIEVLP